MATIGKLSALLTLDSTKFQRGIRRARRAIGNFTRGIGRTIGRVGAFGAAIATVAAGGGMALLLKRSMQNIDATGKLSDALGIATEDLTAFQFAAQQMGADTETLNKGLRVLAKNIGEVATGIGTEAGPALEQLGLDAKTITEGGLGPAFIEIAEKISKVSDAAERAAIAQKLFGRGGMQLTNLLMQGREGIEAFRREGEKLNIMFSRLDAAKVEAANDAINRMKQAIGGVVNVLAIQLSPFITAMANQFTEFAVSASSGAGNIAKSLGGVYKIANLLLSAFDFLKIGFAKMLVSLGQTLADMLRKVQRFFENINFPLDILGWAIADGMEEFISELEKAGVDLTKEIDGIYKKIENRGEALEKVFDDIRKATEEAANQSKMLTPELAEAGLSALNDSRLQIRQQFSSRFGPGSTPGRPLNVQSDQLAELVRLYKGGTAARVA